MRVASIFPSRSAAWLTAAFACAVPWKGAAQDAPGTDSAFPQLELLTRAMETLRQNYVDEKKVTYEQLVEGALEGMLHKLDPHSEYMGKTLFDEMQQEQRDTSDGVGITIALRANSLIIVTVNEDGPAAKAGVLPSDQIIRIGDILTDNMSTMEAVQHLKGKAGEAVRITVRRPSTKQLLDFNLTRIQLQSSSVRDASLLHTKLSGTWKLGYARITEFTQATAKDLSRELDKLEQDGLQAFILDLRNNPGGLLDSAVAVCGEFLPPRTVVVTTEGRVASQNPPPYRTPAREGKSPRSYPLCVLINQSSASASEIVAGALQDLKRGIVVGTTSFGKGSVQTIMPMTNGAALRLTTAKYYTPSHRTIHMNGVEPNIPAALTSTEEAAILQWRAASTRGETRALDLAKLGDLQLERACDVLKGLLIYQQFTKANEPVTKPGPAAEPAPAPTLAPKPPTPPATLPPATTTPIPAVTAPAPEANPSTEPKKS